MRKIIPFYLFLVPMSLLATGFEELYVSALQNNAEYQTAQYELSIQIEQGNQASLAYMPNLALTGTKNYNNSDVVYSQNTPSYQDGSRTYTNHSLMLKLSQPLFRLRNYYSLVESPYYKLSGEIALENVRQTLIYELIKAYLNVLLAEKVEILARVKYDSTGILAKELEKRFKLHEATKTDLHTIRAKLSVSKADEATASYSYQIAKEALIRISQIETSKVDEVKWVSYAVPSEEILWWKEYAKHNNLDVKMSKSIQAVNEIRLKSAWGAHAPTVDLIGSYGKSYSSSDVNGIGADSKLSSIGLQVNIPIFEGGNTQSKVREASAVYNKALSETNKYSRLAQMDSANAYLQLTGSLERYNSLKDASVSSYETIDATKVGLKAGSKTTRDVSDAQEQYYNTQKEMYAAQYDYILNYITLYRISGTLTKTALSQLGII